MSEIVAYEHTDGIAVITLNDGRANALSPNMQAAIVAIGMKAYRESNQKIYGEHAARATDVARTDLEQMLADMESASVITRNH